MYKVILIEYTYGGTMAKIKKLFICLTITLLIFLNSCSQFTTNQHSISLDGHKLLWDNLPDLPDSFGRAGTFAGVSNDALIVAGGANFPYGPPWMGGKKVWYDDIYVMPKGTHKWLKGFHLPHSLAYGVSFTTKQGLIIAGGCDSQKCYADVFLLKWNPTSEKLTFSRLPSLPRPTAFCAGAALGSTVYIAAGQSTSNPRTARVAFWSLDLTKPSGQRKWVSLPPWPGLPRNKSLMVAQNDGDKKYLYLFGGEYSKTDTHEEIERIYLRDTYRFDPDPKTGQPQWLRVSDLPKPLAAGTAINLDRSKIIIFSGSSGIHIYKPIQIRPLFSKDVILYDTAQDRFSYIGSMPLGVVTTNALLFDNSIVIPSGEIRPGIRTPKVQRLNLNTLRLKLKNQKN